MCTQSTYEVCACPTCTKNGMGEKERRILQNPFNLLFFNESPSFFLVGTAVCMDVADYEFTEHV